MFVNKRIWDYFNFITVFLIGYLSFKILLYIHEGKIDGLANDAFGVLEGRPHWIAYQNRLLGPLIIKAIALIGGDYTRAWVIFHFVAIQILCFFLYWIFRREYASIYKRYFFVIAFLSIFFGLQHFYLYPWDIIDLLIFTAFAYGVLKQYRLPYFVFLFIVGIGNRESALFISAFIIINAFKFDHHLMTITLRSFKELAIGIGLTGFGLIYTKLIRTLLFQSKSDLQPDVQHALLGNHINFIQNVKDLFFYNFSNQHFYLSLAISGLIIFYFMQYKRMQEQQLKLLFMILLIFISILVFSGINETRVYFSMIPTNFLLILSLNKNSLKSNP